jgi:uncharacterized repeat protein (TIGR01451 family)
MNTAFRHWLQVIRLQVISLLAFSVASYALAEGSNQMGTAQNQPLMEYNLTSTGLTSTTHPLYVILNSASEVINISLCGQSATQIVRYEIYDVTGTTLIATQTRTGETQTGLCAANPLPNPLNPPAAFRWSPNDNTLDAFNAGTYQLRLHNDSATSGLLNRFDITVTPDKATNPNPNAAQGRVFAYSWGFYTNSFASTASTDANFYTLVPGGRPGTNFVWQLDLAGFSGNLYEIVANNTGMTRTSDSSKVIYSVPQTGYTTSQLYPIYFSYPVNALPEPTTPPTITNFYFVDNAGIDHTISPGSTIGTQDSGSFRFDSDVAGTSLLTIDVNKDGIFGNTVAGVDDVYIFNTTVVGTNTIPWNGLGNTGTALPVGSYQIQLQVRMGEYHFVAGDAETSGGGSNNGLTIYRAGTGGVLSGTQVYWDDLTGFNPDKAGNGGSVSPNGQTSVVGSSTGAFRHTWGNFTSTSFGDSAYVDTYAFGLASYATAAAVIINDDTAANLGLAKSASVSGNQITLDFYLENFAGPELANLTLTDNLNTTFGAGTYSVATPTVVSSGATSIMNINSSFNGSSSTNLLASGSKLGGFETAQIRVVVTINSIVNQGFGLGTYRNSASTTATVPNGTVVSDTSTSSTDPDTDAVASDGTTADGGTGSNDNNARGVDNTSPTVINLFFDYGDAPASYGSSRHVVTPLLYLGSSVDVDTGDWGNGTDNNGNASDDDSEGSDDETAIVTFPQLSSTLGTYTLSNIPVFNNTGGVAYLVGWIDVNRSGVFDTTESATIVVPSSTSSQTVSLTFPSLPGLTAGVTPIYARFRLTTDTTIATGTAATSLPTGAAINGEVEDYRVVTEADLAISKTGSSSVNPSGPVSYTITAWNNGLSAVTGVSVTDTMPASLTGVTWTCSATGTADCDTTALGTGSSGSGNIALSNVSLGIDTGLTTTADTNYITLVIAATAPAMNTSFTNTASVSVPSGVTDTNNSNNSSSQTTTMPQENAKLGIAKAFEGIMPANDNLANNDYTLVYRLTVENFGDVVLSNLAIFDNVATQFSGLNPRNYNVWVNANVTSLVPVPTLTLNTSYDGTAASNVLSSGQNLAVGESKLLYLSFDVTVNPTAEVPNNQLRNNSATASGSSPSANIVTDLSTNGTDPDNDNDGVVEASDSDNNPSENLVTPASYIKVTKELRNCGTSSSSCTGSYVVSEIGKPGDYLEYLIHFSNLSSQPISTVLVLDTLVPGTPFQEDTYGSGVADKEFLVQCPNSSTVTLDKTSSAANTSTLTVSPQVIRVDVLNPTACNLTHFNPTEEGSLMFKVRIP